MVFGLPRHIKSISIILNIRFIGIIINSYILLVLIYIPYWLLPVGYSLSHVAYWLSIDICSRASVLEAALYNGRSDIRWLSAECPQPVLDGLWTLSALALAIAVATAIATTKPIAIAVAIATANMCALSLAPARPLQSVCRHRRCRNFQNPVFGRLYIQSALLA